MDMKLNSQDLEKIVDLTLDCYNQNAEDFWEGTRYHDVSQNIAAMLQYIEGERPFTILDFGCGPGRDLKVFAELGHVAIGLEGAAQFAAIARAYSGCEVWQQDFLKLDLPENYFDGVFANASLFHVPSQELPRVLLELRACLKPGGIDGQGKWLAQVLRGWMAYYAVPMSGSTISAFRHHMIERWHGALMRRSQRRRLTWKLE